MTADPALAITVSQDAEWRANPIYKIYCGFHGISCFMIQFDKVIEMQGLCNSGPAALRVAAMGGAKRIFMVGFDGGSECYDGRKAIDYPDVKKEIHSFPFFDKLYSLTPTLYGVKRG